MPEYFDFHSHLNSKDYSADFDEVINRLKVTKTSTIVVGTDLESSKRAVELAEKYEEIYASIGVHPVDKKSEHFDISKYKELVEYPRVVAIGECGMDFFHADKAEDYERQKQFFVDQINFALEYDKPLMIHARNAYEDILEILKPFKEKFADKLRGNIHFFAGDKNMAKEFFALGFTISFTGVITFTRDYDEVIKEAPLDMILSETDAPYVSPVPYRGKRNEPSYVVEVAKKIAEIRQEDHEKVRVALVNNALRMIG